MTDRHQIMALAKDGIKSERHARIALEIMRSEECPVLTEIWERMTGLRGPHHNASEDAGQPVRLNER